MTANLELIKYDAMGHLRPSMPFGLPVPIGNDSFTKLLLHCNGADASTTFTDSSASAHTVTVGADAQIDTAQSKFGGASGKFDGTGDNLTNDGGADFAFGTGTFTVDFWVRLAATGVQYVLYDSRPAATNGVYPTIYISTGNVVVFFQNSADRITGTTTLSADTWYHVALARSGTSTKLFLSGTQEGSTYTDSNDYLNGTSRPAIAASGINPATTNNLNGWIDEFRVSKGIARWTANFTTPTMAYI
jgi:hypothetical protein